jgi:hypothetical protein
MVATAGQDTQCMHKKLIICNNSYTKIRIGMDIVAIHHFHASVEVPHLDCQHLDQ